jgi:hypothetical protein
MTYIFENDVQIASKILMVAILEVSDENGVGSDPDP